mgnify:CR=1 FL=1|jgi:hypothetical protein|tara:strand:+ start:424 stop:786 length:363 start_codon:yes stop_codon:yes gene_type:complete
MLSLMSSSDSGSSSSISAQQIFDVLISDPRKTMAGGFTSGGSSASSFVPFKPIEVPRGDDGKYEYWAPPMKPCHCDCGTPDGGRHIKEKWPCAYYRNPDKPLYNTAQYCIAVNTSDLQSI